MTAIDTFRAQIGDRGFSKASKFRASIFSTINDSGDNYLADKVDILRNLEYKCTDAEIAGISLLNMDNRYYGPAFKSPYQAQFSDLTLTFYVREDMQESVFFHDWIYYITGDETYDMRFPEEYQTLINVTKINDSGEDEITWTFQKAFPISVQPIPLSWAEQGFVRQTVQFAYQYFKITKSIRGLI